MEILKKAWKYWKNILFVIGVLGILYSTISNRVEQQHSEEESTTVQHSDSNTTFQEIYDYCQSKCKKNSSKLIPHSKSMTICDMDKLLIVQNFTDSSEYDWYEAKRYCENLEVGELYLWRLPTINEARGWFTYGFYGYYTIDENSSSKIEKSMEQNSSNKLYSYYSWIKENEQRIKQHGTMLDESFKKHDIEAVWTSNESSFEKSYAISINLLYGTYSWEKKISKNGVICVHPLVLDVKSFEKFKKEFREGVD